MAKVFRFLPIVAVSVFAFAQGCQSKYDGEPTPQPSNSAKAPAASTVAPPPTAHAPTAAPSSALDPKKSNIAWEAPPSFHPVESKSTLRKATYRVDKAPGDPEDAEMTVISAAGGLEQNIARWSLQFGEYPVPKRSERTVDGLKVTIVELAGTFTGGNMPGSPASPKKKWRVLGAIVDVRGETTFFKLIGPDATVLAAHKDFDKLVGSFKAK